MAISNKHTALIVAAAVIALSACTTVATPESSGDHKHSQQGAQPQSPEMMKMHETMKMEHMDMSEMDMSKMDMSKISAECQDMMKKMKAKMTSDANDSSMMGKGMGNMDEHDMSKMTAMKAKHDKCMAEMKEASPHKHH